MSADLLIERYGMIQNRPKAGCGPSFHSTVPAMLWSVRDVVSDAFCSILTFGQTWERGCNVWRVQYL